MRVIVLDTLEPDGLTLLIEPEFYFWKIEVQCSVFEPFPTQQGCEFPGEVKLFTQLIARRRGQDGVCFLVREPVRTANDATCKTCASDHATFVKVDENRMREPIDSRIEAANTVAQSLGQHRD